MEETIKTSMQSQGVLEMSQLELGSSSDSIFSRREDQKSLVDLLNSQQDSVFGSGEDGVQISSPQVPLYGSQDANIDDTPTERISRRTWTYTDDLVLIFAWLNTNKDPLVGNEQRSIAFWKRIAIYFAASPKIPVGEHMEPSNCKQRWHKMNELVGKFCGAFGSATIARSSGQNDDDVLKVAHEIFLNNYSKKFTLEHAWKEIRYDQKWCDRSSSKMERSSKRRKCEDGQSSTSHASETNTGEADQASKRPPDVKAAKGHGKKTNAEGKALAEFEGIMDLKRDDMIRKERLSKIKILDRQEARMVKRNRGEEFGVFESRSQQQRQQGGRAEA